MMKQAIGAIIGVAGLLTDSPGIAASSTTYTYDALGRLIQATTVGTVNDGVSMSTTYDAADNRTTYQVTGAKSKVIVVPISGLTIIPVSD
tara:strand:- start:7199 stop:7468 length:270 start_codon:yes stop_codon:yes gene_type:complete